MTPRSWSGWAVVAVALTIPAAGLWLAGHPWFPPVLSAHGRGIKHMLDYTLAVTGAFFVAGHLVLAWLVVRSIRRPANPEAPPTLRAQRVVGIVPAVLMAIVAEGGVMALGLPVWDEYYGEPPADAVQVEVTGRQFFWVVRYPGVDGAWGRTDASLVAVDNPLGLDLADPAARDDVLMLNEIHLPADRTSEIRLRSYDVIHSFFVPELFLKQDLMPGMTIPVRVRPTAAGRFELACNQICGLGHYRMRGFVHLEPAAEFERWLGAQPTFASQQ